MKNKHRLLNYAPAKPQLQGIQLELYAEVCTKEQLRQNKNMSRHQIQTHQGHFHEASHIEQSASHQH